MGSRRHGAGAGGFAIVVAIAACGGSDDADANGAAPAPERPVDVADYRNVLPTGFYRVTVTTASCDVNQVFRRYEDGGKALVSRSVGGQPPGINIALPWGGPNLAGAPRQDVSLSTRGVDSTVPGDIDGCAGRSVRYKTTIQALSATRMTIVFERQGIDCEALSTPCTVEAAYELADRACAPTCEPKSIDLVVPPSGGEPELRCSCAG